MKQRQRSSRLMIALFVLAAVLLITGTIGGILASPLRESPFFTASIATKDIGVTLLENGEAVGWRDYDLGVPGNWNERRGGLLSRMLADGEPVQTGKIYPEELRVKNSGTIDNYVRVSLYCYWQDENGRKLQTISPEYIKLALVTGNGWVIDEAATTPERTVLYYTHRLAVGETTPPCCESLTLDPAVRGAVAENGTRYTGAHFRVAAEVDAVQSHNAEPAIRSAWGRDVAVDENGTFTLLYE